jgi:hypothetical protein
MLAYIIDDVTLVKVPKDGITRCYVRFKGGKSEILVAKNPKSSAQQVKTPSEIVELVDRLLNDYTCSEIAEILNEKGFHPGGSARKERKRRHLYSKKGELSGASL